MKFADKIVLNAAINDVWDFLIDPEKLGKCIPGCERIVALDDKNYEAMLGIKVGPISFKFAVETKILDFNPPNFLRFESKGKEKAGAFTQKCILTLKALSPQETEIVYDADVNIGGRLATFGERIFRAKAKELSGEFVASIKSRILSKARDRVEDVEG